jgi:hypothetical protein
MVMDHPTYAYPISVGIGTMLLTLTFFGWQMLPQNRPDETAA